MSDIMLVLPRALSLDPEGRLAEDLSCIKCGCNLRGLNPNSCCPECATAIGRSAHGDLLQFCDPTWVSTLASGMNWIVAGIVCLVLSTLGVAGGISAFGFQGNRRAVIILVAIIIGLIRLIGYWKATTPDPGKAQHPGGLSAQSLVRVTIAIVFGLDILKALLQQSRTDYLVADLASDIVGMVGMFAIFIYARQLAPRIPDERLARQTRTVMWGLIAVMSVATVSFLSIAFSGSAVSSGFTPAGASPTSAPAGTPRPAPRPVTIMASGVGIGIACFIGLGYLFFAVWALILFIRFRRALMAAARQARETWARPVVA